MFLMKIAITSHAMQGSQKVLLRPAAAPAAPTMTSVGAGASKPVSPAGPRKLSDGFEVLLEEAGQQLSDATDFTVIGVLGAQGVGKSTIMSLLAGAPWAGDGGSANLHEPPFAQQPPDVVLQAAHQTSGIDLYVTGERLLLLDTQPLLSPSILLELQRRETSLPSEAQTHENLLELQAVRLAMLLLSTCHVVVCVHDVQLDPLGLRTLRLAQLLRHRLPDLSSLALATPPAAAVAATMSSADAERQAEAAATVVEYSPRLAFVFNRMPPAAFVPGQQANLQTVLRRLFPPTVLAEAQSVVASARGATGEGGGGGVGGGSGGGGDADAATAAADDDDETLLLMLPEADALGIGGGGLGSQMSGAHLGFRSEAEAARDALLAQPRTPFARSLSERDWLRGVGRMWELIKRSALLADYNRALQKLHAYA